MLDTRRKENNRRRVLMGTSWSEGGDRPTQTYLIGAHQGRVGQQIRRPMCSRPSIPIRTTSTPTSPMQADTISATAIDALHAARRTRLGATIFRFRAGKEAATHQICMGANDDERRRGCNLPYRPTALEAQFPMRCKSKRQQSMDEAGEK